MSNLTDEIYKLASKIGVKAADADESIKLLGYKNTLIYTNFCVEHSIPSEAYPKGIAAIVNRTISIQELRALGKKSSLESDVEEIIAKFNLTSKQLQQREYWRKNPLTGKPESGDKVENSRHDYEHRLSRLDRETD